MIGVNFSPKIDQNKLKQILGEIESDKMGGWVNLPIDFDNGELSRIRSTAERIKDDSEVLVCIGIGGSYLGHRAIIEALRPKGGVEIVYAGNSLSKRELDAALKAVEGRDFSINVISKSGTTIEPARAFEIFKEKLAEKYGVAGAIRRIYVTTDGNKGTLHNEAERDNYTRFVIPDNLGGRYSVLSAVGLLPMAAAGVNIGELLDGAADFAESIEKIERIRIDEEETDKTKEPKTLPLKPNGQPDIEEDEGEYEERRTLDFNNPAFKYAFMRKLLFDKGYDTEVFASFEPATLYFNEWLKQLFAESEGKNKRGIFPASVIYSTDLHSMGQFMQDGRRNLFETIINYPTDDFNAKIVEAVQIAHAKGGIPTLKIDVESYDAKGFGELIYFFEMACAVYCKLVGVNPFDQPGVEDYKNELKKLI